MITVTAVLLGSSPSHALSLAQSIKSVYGGQLTTLVDNVRVYCSMRCEKPDGDEIDEKDVMITRILREIKIRDAFEQKLASFGCPYTFLEDSDTDENLTLGEMRACDGANELLTHLYKLESLRSVLALHEETFRYVEAMDALLPYVKKSIFSKDN